MNPETVLLIFGVVAVCIGGAVTLYIHKHIND